MNAKSFIKKLIGVLLLQFLLLPYTAFAEKRPTMVLAGVGSRLVVTNIRNVEQKAYDLVNEALLDGPLVGDYRFDFYDGSNDVRMNLVDGVFNRTSTEAVNKYLHIFDKHKYDYYLYCYITNVSRKDSQLDILYPKKGELHGKAKTIEVDITLQVYTNPNYRKLLAFTGKGNSSNKVSKVRYGDNTIEIGDLAVSETNLADAVVDAVDNACEKMLKSMRD